MSLNRKHNVQDMRSELTMILPQTFKLSTQINVSLWMSFDWREKNKWERSFSLLHPRFSYQPKHIYIQTEENTPINERAYVHVLFSIIWRIVKSIIKCVRLWKREKMKQVLEEKCLQVLRRRLISRAMHFDKRIS